MPFSRGLSWDGKPVVLHAFTWILYCDAKNAIFLPWNRKNLRQFASQGQIRTAALSLKLGQMKVLMDVSGETPVLLLDDVMSELDRNRRLKLIREIEGFQTFITCTDQSDLEED